LMPATGCHVFPQVGGDALGSDEGWDRGIVDLIEASQIGRIGVLIRRCYNWANLGGNRGSTTGQLHSALYLCARPSFGCVERLRKARTIDAKHGRGLTRARVGHLSLRGTARRGLGTASGS